MKKQTIKKYLWITLYLLTIVFLVKYFYSNGPALLHTITGKSIVFILLGLILNIFAFALYGYIWVYMVSRHHNVPRLPVYRSFYVSQITRYVPGNVWSVLARFENNKRFSVPYGATAYYYAIENIMLLSGAFFFSLFVFSLIGSMGILPLCIGLFVFLIGGGIVFFRPQILLKAVKVFEKRFGHESNFSDLSKKELLTVFLLFCGYWTLFGLTFYFLAYGILGPRVTLIEALGMNASAWLIGYFSFITPSGLGVREGAFVFLLKSFTDATTGFSIALLSRFIFTLGELVCLGLVVLLAKWKTSSRKNLDSD